MDKNKVDAVFMGFAALIFMLRPWDVQEGNTFFGLLMMIIATITFGAYTVMGRKTLARVGIFTQTSLSFIIGSLVLLAIIFITGRPVLSGVAEHPLLVAYVGVIVTGIVLLISASVVTMRKPLGD